MCFLSHPRALCNSGPNHSPDWKQMEERRGQKRDRTFVCRFMWHNWLEREKAGTEKAALSTFSFRQDSSKWECFRIRNLSWCRAMARLPVFKQALDLLCAENNRLQREKKNVYFSVKNNFCLPKHCEKYQMPSEWFFSTICLGLNLSVVAGRTLNTAHTAHSFILCAGLSGTFLII